jgi:hypothetical protein
MSHPLVDQLRFTRSEWRRALRGVPEGDGLRRMEPMNSIGWIVAHLAWHEQRYWLTRLSGSTPEPILEEIAAYGRPASTPSLRAMRRAWNRVTRESDPRLDALDEADMSTPLPGSPRRLVGNAMLRVTYHYWFHIGEILAIRQLLGHPNRPEFVGDLEAMASYRRAGDR